MNKFVLITFRFISKFVKVDENQITLIFRGYSGSNLSPILEEVRKGRFENYKITIIEDYKKNEEYNMYQNFLHLFKKYWTIFKSKVVISTHGFYRLRKDTVMINLWHGIPIKSMALMNKSKADSIGYIQDDFFISTSSFFNTIMNACLGIEVSKYLITGYPRNDYLFNEAGRFHLNTILKRKNIDLEPSNRILMYMPTFRDNKSENKGENIFYFDDFDMNMFSKFLDKNQLTLLLKLHPNEESIILERINENKFKNIIIIKSEDLEFHQIDLYKVINAVDLLITDYSSIYFDYLLLDRPIIFTPSDLEEYSKTRGLLLEPYEFWTPGPKCFDQAMLEREILLSLTEPGYYKLERNTLKKIFHKYDDNNATSRVLDLIESSLKK